MDYLHSIVNGYTSKGLAAPEASMRFSEILDSSQYNKSGPNNAQVQRVISLVEDCDSRIKAIYANPDPDYSAATRSADAELVREECSEYIGNIKFSYNTCIRLLRMVELEQYKHIRRRLFNILFGYPNTAFFEYIQHGKEAIHSMERDRHGDREFFGMRFKNT